jgi:hypothetical protein
LSRRVFGILGGLSLVAGGCGSPDAGSTSALQTGVLDLRIGETRPIPGSGLTVTFQRVSEDSRCPSNVACVWAGNGQVELLIHRPEADTTVQLNTTSGPRQADLKGVQLVLDQLAPAPQAPGPVPQEAYVATLSVSPAPKSDGGEGP